MGRRIQLSTLHRMIKALQADDLNVIAIKFGLKAQLRRLDVEYELLHLAHADHSIPRIVANTLLLATEREKNAA